MKKKLFAGISVSVLVCAVAFICWKVVIPEIKKHKKPEELVYAYPRPNVAPPVIDTRPCNGTLLAEYTKDAVYTQERSLIDYFEYSLYNKLKKYRDDAENFNKIYDSVENKNCIYEISKHERVDYSVLRRDYDLLTKEISYWLKVKVNDTEGWFYLYTSKKSNPYLFENDYWVPYDITCVAEDGTEKTFTIRNYRGAGAISAYTPLYKYPGAFGKKAYHLSEEERLKFYGGEERSISVGYNAMTTDSDFDYYKKATLRAENNGVEAWISASDNEHGEMGGYLYRGPAEEITQLCGMGI